MTYVAALQDALAAEHAAVYVHGALGAQTSQSAQPALFAAITAAYAGHRARRDGLVALVRDQGAEPQAAAAAYELPEDLSTEAAVTSRALEVERACAAAYVYLAANAPAAERGFAVTALTTTAVRELAFRGTPEMFPGSDEYADR